MNKIIVGLLVFSCLAPAFALDQHALDNRIDLLTSKFDAMQRNSEKRVPADMLAKAKGIILLDRTKAGFIFAYQGGSGLALVRNKSGNWGPPAFLSANEASLGFQIGGEKNFFVILLMTTNATQSLVDETVDFGGEARGTAGTESAGVEGKVNESPSVVVYSERSGLFGGAAIKGGSIAADEKANIIYYNKPVSMGDILFDQKVKPTEAATALIKKIDDYSKK